MKVSVLLADKGTANPQAGTLNLLNAGWVQTQLRPAPPMLPGIAGGFITAPHAIAAFFEVDYEQCNHTIELVLELLTQDSHPVEVPGPAGPQTLRISQQVTVPSPGGVELATPGSGNALVEIFPGLPLPPGAYRWQASLAGHQGADWYVAFRVIPPAQQPVIAIGGQPLAL
jgi:hypothetical protein